MDRVLILVDPFITGIYIFTIGILIGYLIGKEKDIAPALIISVTTGIYSTTPFIYDMTVEVTHQIAGIVALVTSGYAIGVLIKIAVSTFRMVKAMYSVMVGNK